MEDFWQPKLTQIYLVPGHLAKRWELVFFHVAKFHRVVHPCFFLLDSPGEVRSAASKFDYLWRALRAELTATLFLLTLVEILDMKAAPR